MKSVTGRAFIRLLEARGWELARVHGSHHIYRKPGEVERISVPVHGSTTLKKGLQAHLMKVAGIAPDEL